MKTLATASFHLSRGFYQVDLADLHSFLVEIKRIQRQIPRDSIWKFSLRDQQIDTDQSQSADEDQHRDSYLSVSIFSAYVPSCIGFFK